MLILILTSLSMRDRSNISIDRISITRHLFLKIQSRLTQWIRRRWIEISSVINKMQAHLHYVYVYAVSGRCTFIFAFPESIQLFVATYINDFCICNMVSFYKIYSSKKTIKIGRQRDILYFSRSIITYNND